MEVALNAVAFAVAAVLVGGGALHLAGRGTPVGPPGRRGTAGAWANVLFGAGLALGTAARIPDSHRLLWDDVLLGPAFVCVVVAFLLYVGDRPAARQAVRPEQVALIATLIVFGALSAWLLPDGWRLASLPIALTCATIVQRYVAGRTAQRHSGDDGKGNGHE
ncbi:hypothetical protein OG787_17530 [Streptomyces sp. NBC_00075]|uniref:Integral membrane protein n=1 Tax=Streptomyces sp. NBC_00093 TaxID=2975649 RepID=A0AAU1ZZK3_9ACTN